MMTVIADGETLPTAEIIVLRRIGQMEGFAPDAPPTPEEYLDICASVVGKVVSTGDPFGDFEIIEIVPPDEPALVDADTTVEMN
jgi:hypothetical protein